MPDRRLMLVLAHPDDETFMAGGTIARLVADGGRVDLVCATRGEAGKPGDPPICTRAELPAVREAELRKACRILGVAELTLLGCRDKGVAEAPKEATIARIVQAIRDFRPHVMLTFDPAGVNGHVDHVAIHELAVTAYHKAGDASFVCEDTAPWQPHRLFFPLVPATEHLPRCTIDTAAYRETKQAALRAHRTQHLTIEGFFSRPESAQRLRQEAFVLAYGVPLPGDCDDLFAGLACA